MDWPKAKSILIVSFLLIDLYLAWLLYSASRTAVVTSLTARDVQDLGLLCQHYGMELGADPVPLAVSAAPTLTLLEQTDSVAWAQAMADTWLGADAALTQPTAGSFVFSEEDWTLRATPGRYTMELSLERANLPQGTTASTNDAENTSIARKFLEEYLGQAEALLYQPGVVEHDADGGTVVIELCRVYQNLPSFIDYYRVRVRAGQVVGFKACLSELESGKSGKKLQLVAANRPLTSYLAQAGIQSEQLSISDLRLGFGLLPGEEQTLQPVWRLVTSKAGQRGEVSFPAVARYWEALGQ